MRGLEYQPAKYYPENKDYLLEVEEKVKHVKALQVSRFSEEPKTIPNNQETAEKLLKNKLVLG